VLTELAFLLHRYQLITRSIEIHPLTILLLLVRQELLAGFKTNSTVSETPVPPVEPMREVRPEAEALGL
jgi:hypothetical protein